MPLVLPSAPQSLSAEELVRLRAYMERADFGILSGPLAWRLLATVVAYGEFVEVVADGAEWPDYREDMNRCAWCPAESLVSGVALEHASDCPVTRARRVLNAETEGK